MKNNPIFQLIKSLIGIVGTAYFGYKTIECYDPYVAPIFIVPLIVCVVLAMHGWLKFRGEY